MKICLWTGAAWESWGPSSIDTGGIGGSETAAIHMAAELAKRGHQVTMFGDHAGCEGWYAPDVRDTWTATPPISSYPGYVRYRHYQEGIDDPKVMACDIFISSRDKRAVRLKPDARAKVLWIHDVHCGDDWENDLLSFDRIYCLTKWHEDFVRGVYSHVEPGTFKVTRNGIDPKRFENLDWSAKGPSFVYSSSPDRGLDVLLDMWPKIREFRSDAELHVYYGFENWKKLNAQNKRGLTIVQYMQDRVMSMADVGVHYYGRVGQDQISEAHKKAVVWFYPTAFSETYCISALEAQAAGTAVVSTKLAGLAETASRWPLIEGRNKSPEYQRSAFDQVALHLAAWQVDQKIAAAAAVTPGMCATTNNVKTRAAQQWAMTQTWAGVAEEWESDFENLLGRSEQCGQCGAFIEGFHACPGVPGWEDEP